MKIDRTRLFDKRVVQRNIRAGRVTKEEYAAWLAETSDSTDKIMAPEEGGDDDGYEAKSEDGAPAEAAPAAPAEGAPAPAPAVAPAAAPAEAAPPAPPSEPPPAG